MEKDVELNRVGKGGRAALALRTGAGRLKYKTILLVVAVIVAVAAIALFEVLLAYVFTNENKEELNVMLDRGESAVVLLGGKSEKSAKTNSAFSDAQKALLDERGAGYLFDGNRLTADNARVPLISCAEVFGDNESADAYANYARGEFDYVLESGGADLEGLGFTPDPRFADKSLCRAPQSGEIAITSLKFDAFAEFGFSGDASVIERPDDVIGKTVGGLKISGVYSAGNLDEVKQSCANGITPVVRIWNNVNTAIVASGYFGDSDIMYSYALCPIGDAARDLEFINSLKIASDEAADTYYFVDIASRYTSSSIQNYVFQMSFLWMAVGIAVGTSAAVFMLLHREGKRDAIGAWAEQSYIWLAVFALGTSVAAAVIAALNLGEAVPTLVISAPPVLIGFALCVAAGVIIALVGRALNSTFSQAIAKKEIE